MPLSAHHLTLGYGRDHVVEALDLAVAPGRVTALVGANASGKSTLLRALGRLLRPRSGGVLLDGQAIVGLSTREVARRMAILPQAPPPPDSLTVRQLVAQGRYPYQRMLGRRTADDDQAIAAALASTGIEHLADRPLDELSGGQRQHAWIALTLAQETDVLLLDEPTTYLDMAHQVEVLDLLDELNRRDGRTIVMVLHDLNQAARYADELVALRGGRIVASGPPGKVVTEEMVQDVFGLEVRILEDPLTGGPLCVPARGGRTAIRPIPAVP
jgi:iron complex transport system ATP-binding protein